MMRGVVVVMKGGEGGISSGRNRGLVAMGGIWDDGCDLNGGDDEDFDDNE